MTFSEGPFAKIWRLRKKMSPAMEKMLKRLRAGEKIRYDHYELGSREMETLAALARRRLIARDASEEYFIATSFTDEMLLKYVEREREAFMFSSE